MTFKEFFKLMFDALGGSKDKAVFMRELFDAILDLPKDGSVLNPLYDKTAQTLRKYANPNDEKHNLPMKVVKPIHKYVRASCFATYLKTYEPEDLEKLVTALQPYINDVDISNVHDRCADLFQDILDELVGYERNPSQMSLATVMDSQLPISIRENYGSRLLLETHGICPAKDCTNELYEITSAGIAEPSYIPTLIDGYQPPSYENLIALCPACHARYMAEQNSGDYEASQQSQLFLKNKKQELMMEESTNTVLSRHEVESGVDRLLRKIQDDMLILSDAELEAIKLNYDPVKVRQKIPATDRDHLVLLKKVLRYVIQYYNLVDQNLINLNKEKVIRQRVFSSQIRSLFIEFDETSVNGQSVSQSVIFDRLVDWLHGKTEEDKDVCAIVISYFIQSCEVFDVISE